VGKRSAREGGRAALRSLSYQSMRCTKRYNLDTVSFLLRPSIQLEPNKIIYFERSNKMNRVIDNSPLMNKR